MDIMELDSFADDPLLAVPIEGDFDSAEHIPSNRSIANSFSSDLCVSVVAPAPSKSILREGKPDVVKVKILTMTTQTKKIQIMATDQKIRRMIAETGTQHVYFGGRGEYIRNNPGNVRFRSIAVDKYFEEYHRASNTLKLRIRNDIEGDVKSDGSKFIVVVVTNGNVSQRPAEHREVLKKTLFAFSAEWNRRAKFWSWADPVQEQVSWSNYSRKDGYALERTFQEDLDRREKVFVTVRNEKHLVDIGSMKMHRADANVNNNVYLLVRRLEPEEEIEDSGQLISGPRESDGQGTVSQELASETKVNHSMGLLRSVDSPFRSGKLIQTELSPTATHQKGSVEFQTETGTSASASEAEQTEYPNLFTGE